jgi:choline dehydrogenase
VLFTDESASILSAATAQSPDGYLAADTDATVLAGFNAIKEIITANLGSTTTGGFEIFHDNASILVPSILHPCSRRSVEINSLDPFTEPTIDPRYGSNPPDLQIVIEGIKFMQKMINTPPMQTLLPVQVAPPAAATLSDELLTLWVQAGVQTNYHPSGTASILLLDMGGVVDTNLLVYRTSNLRVVDSGMFPLLSGSHIGAAVYAVSEKVGYSSFKFPGVTNQSVNKSF